MADWRTVLAEVDRRWASAPALAALTAEDRRREARLLAAAVTGRAPVHVAGALDTPAPAAAVERLATLAARRARGEPLAYCTGTAAFRTLELAVDARVLIPRPETEVVVEEALRVTADRPGGTAVDVGTGSGAIALALAAEGRFDAVIGTDLSADALAVAAANVHALPPGSAAVSFRHGADLAPLRGVRARVLVSNPPYIAYAEARALPADVRDWEPPAALFAADDGMARYEVLLGDGMTCLEPGGFLVLELDSRRAERTADRARALGWRDVQVRPDLAGRPRVLVARAR